MQQCEPFHIITIHVTEEHIAKARRWQRYFQSIAPDHPGRKGYPSCCPIAFALKATGRFKNIRVTMDCILTSDAGLEHVTKERASRIIGSFDLGINQPIPQNEFIRPATLQFLVITRHRPSPQSDR